MPSPKMPSTESLEDLFALLEVSPFASAEVLRAAHKALMMKYHPDNAKGSADEKRAQSVDQAYRILSSEKERARFVQKLKDRTGITVGPYVIKKLIAEGGFGRTYIGEHTLTKLPVCVKDCSAIEPEFDDVLVQEAKAMWDLRHFAIPAVRDVLHLDNGRLALVMSHIKGKTLEQVVEKAGRLDPEHVAWITERALNALMYLHHHGVIHGDVKPQNIIVQPEHTLVLVDYGLAVVKQSSHVASKGFTPFYAPPEEVAGQPLLPESDFYSLGMTMIYALSGSHDHVARANVPNHVPKEMCDFIRRLIVRDVLGRPQWDKDNLFEEIQKLRVDVFGRSRSGMKKLPGVD